LGSGFQYSPCRTGFEADRLAIMEATHVHVRLAHGGWYRHWGARTIWFAASDNTDPRTNGREYKIVYHGANAK
jgi:hypothetical protein